MSNFKKYWRVIRKVWVIAGSTALVFFVSWSLIAYRASNVARQALISTERVQISQKNHYWTFLTTSTEMENHTGLLFFPGALVDPAAYAPIVHEIAKKGYPALLIQVPMRCAFGGADGDEVMNRAHAAMASIPSVSKWVIAGHSRGGAIASRFVFEHPSSASGLILIGTSHPRDFSLSKYSISVTKILGTNDWISPLKKSEHNRDKLPESTQWILIEGGNHSQFGYYGFQPGDAIASIDREDQQNQMLKAIFQTLESVK